MLHSSACCPGRPPPAPRCRVRGAQSLHPRARCSWALRARSWFARESCAPPRVACASLRLTPPPWGPCHHSSACPRADPALPPHSPSGADHGIWSPASCGAGSTTNAPPWDSGRAPDKPSPPGPYALSPAALPRGGRGFEALVVPPVGGRDSLNQISVRGVCSKVHDGGLHPAPCLQ